jgi:hypothetical protein
MRSQDLTTDQAEALKAKIGPMHGYLNRLIKRMNRKNFPRDDELFHSVLQASAAIHDLNVRLHYLSCGHGVGPKDSLSQPHDQPQRSGNQGRGDY